MAANAAAGRFPKGLDVFRHKFHGLFYAAPNQDAFMLRLRLPGGIVSSYQARGLADVAERFGGGTIDLTTRANLQIREIGAGDPIEVLTAIAGLLADALGRNLAETYRRIYGDQEPRMAHALDEAAVLVIERIASSDALYHNCEHTALVTLCVQDILRGRRLERTITPSDWGHTILAALNHDIGYVRGICAGDTAEHFVIDAGGKTVAPPRGASDAFLTPYHVERGKIKVRERFAPVPFIDEERIASAIELTRFPVPDDEDHAATDTEAGLVRAGDLIGQLGDPVYPRKLNALYHEFVETGVHEKLGYRSPADLVDHYPQFYWSKVERYIGDALRYLEMTMEGKQWTATLYSHIFAIEHNRRRMGPQSASPQQQG
jgi:hypothetical protein